MPEDTPVDPHEATTSCAPREGPTEDESGRAGAADPNIRKIGGYTIKRVIATGGMGTVYLALQEHPRRTVALKVMKSGIASRSTLRRFEFEAQILARLRHPNIAQVYDAGTHDDGSGSVPYFAMEYIPNAKTITEYAHHKSLTTRQRLEIFATVCDAVAQGHHKGVIHRDLKPSNIVVDSSGQPKVIDFGVARATDSDMAVTTLQTDVGELIGTLQYMSPEQCDADPHDIDTRSDVYALGVVLYELMCGQLPYDVGHLAIFEAVRVIRETDPPRPSSIKRMLRGDIETIALKALDKDRSRRYRTAAELGEDIGRYLRDEPILARRPSIIYQMRVFLRRQRVIVGVAAFGLVVFSLAAIGGWLALVNALAIGLLGLAYGFLRARRAAQEASAQRDEAVHARLEAERERNRALVAERQADEQRAGAEAARHRAELEARKSLAINEFLIQDMLGCANPTEARGRNITVRDVLENAARQIEFAFREQPEIAAALRDTIGTVYKSLGRFHESLPHLRAALKLRRKLLGNGHPDVATSLNNLAQFLYEMGDCEDAEPMFREALEIRRGILGNDHPHVATVLSNLSSVLRVMEDYDAAMTMCLEALQINQRAHGRQHPAVAINLIRLAKLWEARKDYASAETLYRQALGMQRSTLGEDHLHVAVTLNHLGQLLRRRSRLGDAEPLLREAVSIFRQRLGSTHQNVLVTMNSLAQVLMALGNSSGAEPVLRELIGLAETTSEGPGPLTGIQTSYGECLMRLGRFDDAEQVLLAAHAALKDDPRPRPRQSQRIIHRLVELYAGRGKDDKAAEFRALLPAAAVDGHE